MWLLVWVARRRKAPKENTDNISAINSVIKSRGDGVAECDANNMSNFLLFKDRATVLYLKFYCLNVDEAAWYCYEFWFAC